MGYDPEREKVITAVEAELAECRAALRGGVQAGVIEVSFDDERVRRFDLMSLRSHMTGLQTRLTMLRRQQQGRSPWILAD